MPVTPELLHSLCSLPISGSTKVATASAAGGEGGRWRGGDTQLGGRGEKWGWRRECEEGEMITQSGEERGTNEHIKGFNQKSSRRRNSR